MRSRLRDTVCVGAWHRGNLLTPWSCRDLCSLPLGQTPSPVAPQGRAALPPRHCPSWCWRATRPASATAPIEVRGCRAGVCTAVPRLPMLAPVAILPPPPPPPPPARLPSLPFTATREPRALPVTPSPPPRVCVCPLQGRPTRKRSCTAAATRTASCWRRWRRPKPPSLAPSLGCPSRQRCTPCQKPPRCTYRPLPCSDTGQSAATRSRRYRRRCVVDALVCWRALGLCVCADVWARVCGRGTGACAGPRLVQRCAALQGRMSVLRAFVCACVFVRVRACAP
jgi:hypothetical protein